CCCCCGLMLLMRLDAADAARALAADADF
nr:hypothetical protein [Tanacetum cinerariifolium]